MMHDRIASEDVARLAVPDVDRVRWRNACRDLTLQNALRKRSAGVPTYSVPEAAALMSVSQEHLYRLIRAGAFPAVRMRAGREHGRYVVPAKAVEALLDAATDANSLIDVEATSTSVLGGAL
jgi:excisionase family DNA binding protein